MRLSVFINTLNEAKRIRACLQSVSWADEIVIVDMHSDDDTVAVCREFTDKVYYVDRLGYCEPARKFAAQQTSGDWILNIDADELVTAGLKDKIRQIMAEDTADAVYLPRKNFFWGEEMRYSGCGLMQDRPLRLYKRNAVEFSDTIHAGIQLAPNARVLKVDDPNSHLVHFSYLTPEQYFSKMERYTTIEAKALFAAGKEYSPQQARKDVIDAFWKRYVSKSEGRRDGQWGLIYCLWTAVYKLNIYAKYLLMKKYNTVDYARSIEEKYADIIRKTLEEFSGERA